MQYGRTQFRAQFFKLSLSVFQEQSLRAYGDGLPPCCWQVSDIELSDKAVNIETVWCGVHCLSNSYFSVELDNVIQPSYETFSLVSITPDRTGGRYLALSMQCTIVCTTIWSDG